MNRTRHHRPLARAARPIALSTLCALLTLPSATRAAQAQAARPTRVERDANAAARTSTIAQTQEAQTPPAQAQGAPLTRAERQNDALVRMPTIAQAQEAQTPPAQAQGAPLTLAELEQRALARNPTIAAASAQVEAAKGRATQAGTLPNPTIGYMGDEISGGSVNRGGEHGFFVQQTIPLGGKLSRGREVFTREAEAAAASTDAQRQRVLTAVRRAYRAALIAERRVTVRDQLARLATEAVDISRQLFNTGVADKPDTMAAEIEMQRAQLALVDAQNARLRIWREMGSLVGDPSLAPRALTGSADDPLPDFTHDATLARILKESPEIEAVRRDTVRAEAAVTRAKRETAPDLALRAGPRYNRELLEPNLKPVGWEASFEVGVTVPLFNRNKGGIAEAAADLARSRAEVQRTELDARSRVAEAFEQYDTARRAVDIYTREILPRAGEAYTMYQRSYQQMAAAYPQVLMAQRTLFQSTDQYLDALDRAWQAAIELSGFVLTEAPDRGLDAPRKGWDQ